MKRIGKYTTWIGLLIIVVGFIYDIMFAGIPPQDAPAHIALRYDQEYKIASQITDAGLIITVVGGLIWLGYGLIQILTKKT